MENEERVPVDGINKPRFSSEKWERRGQTDVGRGRAARSYHFMVGFPDGLRRTSGRARLVWIFLAKQVFLETRELLSTFPCCMERIMRINRTHCGTTFDIIQQFLSERGSLETREFTLLYGKVL